MSDETGRFGHHPDPAINFCIEVDCIAGLVFDFRNGLAAQRVVGGRIGKALDFTVGGDKWAVAAKERLRELADEFLSIGVQQ